MDPNKTPSAPPMWSEEKASMVESPAPPPYEDHPYPGYPPPGPGYPVQPQGPGYPQQYAGAGYGQQPYPTAQPYPAQPGAVTAQPTLYMAQGPLQNPVNDYLGYSIFTMLCCCLPVGIAALIYSILAREANHSGDRMSAERNSKTSRTLNHVALGLGIGGTVLFIIYILVATTAF